MLGIYKRMMAYAPERRWGAWAASLLSALSALLTAWAYWLVADFLRGAIVDGNLRGAASVAAAILALLIAGQIVYLLSGFFSHLLGFRLETNLRKKGIEGLTSAGARFFDQRASGYARKTIDDNAAKTHMAVAHLIPDWAHATVLPALAVAVGFHAGMATGLAVLAWAAFAAVNIPRMMGNGEFMKLYTKALEDLASETVEYVRNIQVIKIFGLTLNSVKALRKAIDGYSQAAFAYTNSCKTPYSLHQWAFMGSGAILAIFAAAWASGAWGLAKPLGAEAKADLAVQLAMAFFLISALFVSVMKIMWFSMYLFNAKDAVDKLESLYGEMKAARPPRGNEGKIDGNGIEFDNVTFSYGRRKVLDGLSFKLEPGKTYALVGPSGGGKTTIAKLIAGFLAPDSGAVKIGGKSLTELSESAVAQSVSFVFQNPKLFKGSILDNVLAAKKGASREEALNALKAAGCGPILDKFEQREEAIIGSQGVWLSLGEIQRIAVARAALKDAPVVVLDEATASIDADNEHEMQKALSKLMAGKTAVIVAHRLSAIRGVDEILVVKDGAIAQRGSDAELSRLGGEYAEAQRLYQEANEWRMSHV